MEDGFVFLFTLLGVLGLLEQSFILCRIPSLVIEFITILLALTRSQSLVIVLGLGPLLEH